jgi:hypothetical protein
MMAVEISRYLPSFAIESPILCLDSDVGQQDRGEGLLASPLRKRRASRSPLARRGSSTKSELSADLNRISIFRGFSRGKSNEACFLRLP